MNQGFLEQEALITREGALGIITLNRPKALNSITLEMIRQIAAALRSWEKDPTLKAVYFHGAGERAFSAGGDLKLFHGAGMDFRRGLIDLKIPALFFAEEYSLNRQIFHYPKPTISFMNGITMGGGFGIAGNVRYRIATEKTLFAMPETAIGFFPDVGSMYHLMRCPSKIGHYLALTGTRIKAQELVDAALADHLISTENEFDLINTLYKSNLSSKTINRILAEFSAKRNEETEISHLADRIENIFSIPRIDLVLTMLEKDNSPWAKETLEIFKKRSPTSVLVTAEYLTLAAEKKFDEITRTDFILAQKFIGRMDLYEGIRAVLIDKDNHPQWNPASYSEITHPDILRYFEPEGQSLDEIEIFNQGL